MSADQAMKFGDYVYADIPGLFIEEMEDPMETRQRTADTPGADGGFTAGSLLSPRRFPMSGLLTGTIADDLRTAWEAFRAAHRPGMPRKFYFHSDRYCWAECVGITKAVRSSMARVNMPFEVEFLACNPFYFADPEIVTSGLAAGGTVDNDGTAESRPLLTLAVSSIGTGGTITVSNTTTGDSFVLTPTLTGTYIIDSATETCTRGGVDKSGEIAPFGSNVNPYIRLAPGVNTLAVSTADGATLTSITSVHNDAFV